MKLASENFPSAPERQFFARNPPARPLAPQAIPVRSTIVTLEHPASVRWKAIDAPMIPPPMMQIRIE